MTSQSIQFAYRTQAGDGAIRHFSEQVVSNDGGGTTCTHWLGALERQLKA